MDVESTRAFREDRGADVEATLFGIAMSPRHPGVTAAVTIHFDEPTATTEQVDDGPSRHPPAPRRVFAVGHRRTCTSKDGRHGTC